MPLISVIVPCYNQAQYLDECLQSVLDQTYTDWECIIVNDGSPDHTEEIAKKWVEKDARFKYLYKENGGLSSARNAGIEIAKGEWIQFLDCDDILKKEKFEISTNFFLDHDIVLTNFMLFKNGEEIPPFCDLETAIFDLENIILKWDNGLNIPIHCAIFSKKTIENLKFDTKLKSKEDWDFWIQFYTVSKKTYFINSNLVLYRINPNTLGTNIELIYIANEHIYKKYNSEIKSLLFTKLNNLNLELVKRNIFLSNNYLKIYNNKLFKIYNKIRSVIKR